MKQNYSEMPNGYLETIQNGIAGVRTFRSGLSRGTGTRQENLERLKEEIRTADAIVIGAGAGLSTAAGFIYTGERFEKWFSDFIRTYGIRDMYSGGFYPYPSKEIFWAYWARYIYVNRYLDPPKPTYLAKIALDISAKKTRDHMGYLDEELFRETLWDHTPLTDFWGIAHGKANRLSRYGIYTMRDIANAPQDLLYKVFGVDAELMIDHAWGRESCLMCDIKKYRSKCHSVSFSQILPRDYDYEEAAIVMAEMAIHGCLAPKETSSFEN